MSTNQSYRLADTTAIEPLVNRWVAWSHVLAPATYSLHLHRYQVNLLKSYVEYPELHLEACRDPQTRYGPFVDVPAERADEVGKLLSAIKTGQKANLDFAEALVEFQNELVKQTNGESLEPFYSRIPDPLRGYVELIYDYENHPIVRLFETLLYNSPYYDRNLQSLRIFRQERDNSRSFFMSTPRLSHPEHIEWETPFENPEVDDLFKLDSTPKPLGRIRELLRVKEDDEARLLPLVADGGPPVRESWNGAGARLRYIGHACVLIEYNGQTILTDPWIGVTPGDGGVERVTFAELPERIDFALITHGHPDHFCIETLLRLRHKIECLVVHRSSGVFYGDVSLKLLTQKIGFRNVVEVDTLDSIRFKGGEIVAVPFIGEQADLPHGKTAYVVCLGDERVLFGADSNCLDRRMYDHVRELVGSIQTVFIGMECVGAPLSWMYQALLPMRLDRKMDQSRRLIGCDSTRALQILEALGSSRVYVYAMGLEPWLEYLLGLTVPPDSVQIRESNKLIGEARRRGFDDARLLCGKTDIYVGAEFGYLSGTA